MNKFISQKVAKEIDLRLMNCTEGAFSIDQLMELAGLCVAQAIHAEFSSKLYKTDHNNASNVIIVCGHGNNGGDGLVAARHLWQFGWKPSIVYPKLQDIIDTSDDNNLYKRLLKQCSSLDIPIDTNIDIPAGTGEKQLPIIVDAVFGFGFKGSPRAPYDSLLENMKSLSAHHPIVSIDVPSGWDVELGNIDGKWFTPDVLVSLTCPKLCAKNFAGKHYIGGRFVPPFIRNDYNLFQPEYPGSSQVVLLQSSY